MNQNPIQSQTASFSKVHSQTTPRLFQHPTTANTVKYKSKSGLVLASIVAIAVCGGGLFSCTAHQNAVAKIGSAQS
ncbi:hypothetical protein [Acinetobacter sp. ANC 4648]|uniref:hypothetical protein n=1 Tax=Acinetobacter sp. ANC 4648 TaxID=1977875 RepID=UPI000A34AD91|nr:hypothetical protein [Acinetobacter sp. ANC 4648]OTG81780.1 hypothetical protein B9T27_09595 [Acinetobacter sp. ANC 4648]